MSTNTGQTNTILYILLIIFILFVILLFSRQKYLLDYESNEGFINELHTTSDMGIFMPQLIGGLGNNLFQLCAVLGLAKKHNAKFAINLKYMENSQHADNKGYFSTIFKNFKPLLTDTEALVTVAEKEVSRLDDTAAKGSAVLLTGYYQDYTYLDPVRAEFIDMLSFNKEIVHAYPRLDVSMFLHIRGGDFKNNPIHDLDLKAYYERAIAFAKSHSVAHYYIFTNDVEYAKTFSILDSIDHTFIGAGVGELDSLYLMSQCRLGGIASNSSFSFWGLYLDTNRPFLVMPSKWYARDPGTPNDYYFKGAIKIDV